MKQMKFTTGLLIGLILIGLVSATSVYTWPWATNQSSNFTNLSTSGDTRVQGTLMAAGNAQINKEFGLVATSVSLTSPTVQFSATNRSLIILGSDVNQTNVRPINGTTGQELWIYASATGTATLTFVDATSTMALGSNRVLTCGNYSFIKLLCTGGGDSTASTWLLEDYQAN